MSIALGNNKPEALLAVETILWRALFAISEGSKLPEAIVEEVLAQIPWEKLSSDPAQRNWFDIRASPVPSPVPVMVAGQTSNLLTRTAPPVSTPQSLPALALPESIAKSLNHQVQGAVRDSQDMDTDTNELCSTGELIGGHTECGTIVQDARTPLESSLEEDNGLQSSRTAREDVAPTEALSETITVGKGGRSTSETKGTPDGLRLESPGVGEDFETTTIRRSARLNSKGKATEGGPENIVLPTSGTSRSFSPQKRKGKSTKPKQMSPENESPRPPVATESALKRKVPPEIEELLSGGSSAVKPIDVDALNAVLERFPVKRELQVCNFKFSTSGV